MRDIQDSFICQSQKSGFILLPDTSPNLKSTLTIRGLKEFVYVLVQWETRVKPSTSNNTFLQSTDSQNGILIYSSFPVQKSSPFIIHKWHHSRSQSHTHTLRKAIFLAFLSLFLSSFPHYPIDNLSPQNTCEHCGKPFSLIRVLMCIVLWALGPPRLLV